MRLRTICPKRFAMAEIRSFRDVIDLWASKEAMAVDLRAIDPVANASAISKWWQRDAIPAEWWASLLATEVGRNNSLNAEMLTTFAAREPIEARA